MRIVILTGSLPHHKHFCLGLSENFEILGILISTGKKQGLNGKFNKLVKEIQRNGLMYTALRWAGKKLGLPLKYNYADEEKEFFPGAVERFSGELAGRVFNVNDINSESAIAQIRALNPDVVVCLGGVIYSRALIESVPLMLNWHSGISPVYNGACSIEFAFANGHPHLAGGTLMVINPKVDGGDILAHHLVEIEPGDTPARLFMKTVRTAPEVYTKFLSHLQNSEPYVAVEQPPALFETTASDWTLYQSLKARKMLRQGLTDYYARPGRTVCYWEEGDKETARKKLTANVDHLLFDSQKY